jgi:tRNA (cmo5U34)-methyltransferase
MSKDKIYSEQESMIVDFAFDEKVANVFPDMIRRSVPGYETIITMVGLIAAEYAQANSSIYDLGCSLGASSLSILKQVKQPGCKIIAVDNSQAMLDKCSSNLNDEKSDTSIELLCSDIQDIEIENASVVVMNFTLQFIAPEQRFALMQKIYHGLRPGGVLILSEKIIFANDLQQDDQESLQLAFKKANGYSELEISQKRTALENVLIPDTLELHQDRLNAAGFSRSNLWFQCFNFISLIAVK